MENVLVNANNELILDNGQPMGLEMGVPLKQVIGMNSYNQDLGADYHFEINESNFSGTTIPTYKYYYNLNLSKVNISRDLTSIGQRAFYSCKNLRNIILGNVNSIGTYCFGNMEQSFVIDFRKATRIPNIDSNAFYGTYSTRIKIVVPDSLYDEWNTKWSPYVGQLSTMLVKASEYVE